MSDKVLVSIARMRFLVLRSVCPDLINMNWIVDVRDNLQRRNVFIGLLLEPRKVFFYMISLVEQFVLRMVQRSLKALKCTATPPVTLRLKSDKSQVLVVSHFIIIYYISSKAKRSNAHTIACRPKYIWWQYYPG